MSTPIKIISATLFVVALLTAAMFWFRTYNMFVLNRVVVRGLDAVSRDEVLALARPDFSKEIFQQDIGSIRRRIETHPLIEHASVHRFLPSGLFIQVKERDLVAVIPGERLSVADKDGTIIRQENFYAMYDLPIITGTVAKMNSSGIITADDATLKGIRLLYAIREVDRDIYHDISELHIDSKAGYIVYLRSRMVPIIFGTGDLAIKASNFIVLYHYLKQHEQLASFKALDVRFHGQVVGKL